MANPKYDFEKFTSPRGTASYPKLNTPDTKFKADGEYSIKLVVKAEDAAELVAKIDARHEAYVTGPACDEEHERLLKKNPKAKRPVRVKESVLPYSVDEETGDVTFKFSMPAKHTSKKNGKTYHFKPALFDAAKNKLEGVEIGGGSICRVAAEFRPYFVPGPVGAGISLRLVGVQVIELRQWSGSASADDLGFEAEEEGELTEEISEETEDSSTDDNGGDF